MKESNRSAAQRRKSTVDGPAIQVICLGSGGGPSEDNVTGFLVRSLASEWTKGSLLAVDAGSHLASITRMLEKDFPLVSSATHNSSPIAEAAQAPSIGGDAKSVDDSSDSNGRSLSPEIPETTLKTGPFAGLAFPYTSARANATHIVREHVAAYLITHPHLDHLSGFVINTAAYNNTSRPKRLAALPFTVNAIKTHIFNDIIWPNLTDEDNGVGFVTFQRLTEGGNLALGEGTSRGFIEVCNGLAVKGFKVSHGNCASAPRPEHNIRRNSNPQSAGHQLNHSIHAPSHSISQHNLGDLIKTPVDGGRRSSVFSQAGTSQPGTPTVYGQPDYVHTVVDSTAYFIRAEATGKEILIFGDVEPDSISFYPRTHIVWSEASSKIAHGLLTGIFIECSYNDAQKDAVLFGHLAPRHLIQELQTLADMVADKKKEADERVTRKRKRASTGLGVNLGEESGSRRSRSQPKRSSTPKVGSSDEMMGDVPEEDVLDTEPPTPLNRWPRVSHQHNGNDSHRPTPQRLALSRGSTDLAEQESPLKGVRIIIIHVKDHMNDGPLVGESILQELRAYESRLDKMGKGLGCTFDVSTSGNSYWF